MGTGDTFFKSFKFQLKIFGSLRTIHSKKQSDRWMNKKSICTTLSHECLK